MVLINETFKNFVCFSFPSIETYINDEGIEKKKLLFNGVEWRNILSSSTHWSHSAVAVICGKISNITVIDVDDMNEYHKLVKKYNFLSDVFRVKTYKGIHLYFNYDPTIKTTTNAFMNYKNIDIRNDKSICICPPTTYKLVNGDIFEYKYLGGEIIEIPKELLTEFKQFHNNKLNIRSRSKLNINTQEQKEDYKELKFEIGELLGKLPVEYYDNYDNWVNIGFIIFNELGLNGFELFNDWSSKSKKYNKTEVYDKYHSFGRVDNGLKLNSLKMMVNNINKPTNIYDILINFNTGDNAEYFKTKYKNKFMFSNDRLYYFNCIYWKEDDNNYSYLNNFIDEVYFYDIYELYQKYEIEELKQNDNKEDKKELYKRLDGIKTNIRKLKNFKARNNFMMDIICKLSNNSIEWNKHTNLFVFNNKIYDIELNKFVEAKPEYYINMSCGWNWEDQYDVELVNKLDEFIKTIHTNDEIRTFYLTCLSTGLSGQTLEKFIIANGKGGNGKGVINELAMEMFGDYGYVLPSNILLNPLKTGSNPELANCNFKRFVLVREPDDNYKLNCATIKELTGGNKINARLNHSNDTDTHLNLTLIMECNEKPKLSEVNEAMQRRILDIPFNSSFVEKHIYDKLDDDEKENIFIGDVYYKSNEFKQIYRQALFILLTKYYNQHYEHKCQLEIPKLIEERTTNYMSNSDEIVNIIEEVLVKTNDKNDIIKLKELFEIVKSSDMYMNMNKEEKRKLNYKTFCSKLETNMFMKKYVCENKDKIKILKCFKMKDGIEDSFNYL